MEDRASLLGQLTRVVADTSNGSPLALRLCTALTEVLGMDGASISVGYSSTNRNILCSTDEQSEQFEDLQDLLRQGPSLDAYRLGHPVTADTNDITRLWPMLSQALVEPQGLVSILALPMRPERDALGVVLLHRRGPAAVDTDLHEAQFLANAIGVAILGGFERAEPAETLWSSRDKINQAAGMVVAQLRLPPADALAVLRAHAFAQGTSLQAIANSVLARDLVFRSPEDPESDES